MNVSRSLVYFNHYYSIDWLPTISASLEKLRLKYLFPAIFVNKLLYEIPIQIN